MLSNRGHGYFCRWSAEDNHYHVQSHTAKRFILIKLCPFHVVLWMFHAARDSDFHPYGVSLWEDHCGSCEHSDQVLRDSVSLSIIRYYY